MKKNVFLLAGYLLLGLVSCNEGDQAVFGGVDIPVIYARRITLSEMQPNDAATVGLTQSFFYDELNRLTTYTMQQSFTSGEAVIMNETTVVTYESQQVRIEDESGNSFTYMLDAGHGYAVSCLHQTLSGSVRRYEFTYTAVGKKHYLCGMKEFLGDSSEPFSMLSMNYTDDEYLVITKQMNGYTQQFRVQLTADCPPNSAQLPLFFYTELYPLSQHAVALYARLLGAANSVMPLSVTPLENNYKEQCIYSYKLVDNLPESCVIKLSDRKESRKINYIFEGV